MSIKKNYDDDEYLVQVVLITYAAYSELNQNHITVYRLAYSDNITQNDSIIESCLQWPFSDTANFISNSIQTWDIEMWEVFITSMVWMLWLQGKWNLFIQWQLVQFTISIQAQLLIPEQRTSFIISRFLQTRQPGKGRSISLMVDTNYPHYIHMIQ